MSERDQVVSCEFRDVRCLRIDGGMYISSLSMGCHILAR